MEASKDQQADKHLGLITEEQEPPKEEQQTDKDPALITEEQEPPKEEQQADKDPALITEEQQPPKEEQQADKDPALITEEQEPPKEKQPVVVDSPVPKVEGEEVLAEASTEAAPIEPTQMQPSQADEQKSSTHVPAIVLSPLSKDSPAEKTATRPALRAYSATKIPTLSAMKFQRSSSSILSPITKTIQQLLEDTPDEKMETKRPSRSLSTSKIPTLTRIFSPLIIQRPGSSKVSPMKKSEQQPLVDIPMGARESLKGTTKETATRQTTRTVSVSKLQRPSSARTTPVKKMCEQQLSAGVSGMKIEESQLCKDSPVKKMPTNLPVKASSSTVVRRPTSSRDDIIKAPVKKIAFSSTAIQKPAVSKGVAMDDQEKSPVKKLVKPLSCARGQKSGEQGAPTRKMEAVKKISKLEEKQLPPKKMEPKKAPSRGLPVKATDKQASSPSTKTPGTLTAAKKLVPKKSSLKPGPKIAPVPKKSSLKPGPKIAPVPKKSSLKPGPKIAPVKKLGKQQTSTDVSAVKAGQKLPAATKVDLKSPSTTLLFTREMKAGAPKAPSALKFKKIIPPKGKQYSIASSPLKKDKLPARRFAGKMAKKEVPKEEPEVVERVKFIPWKTVTKKYPLKHLNPLKNDRVLKVAKGMKPDKIPVWLLFQAGKHSNAYRKLEKEFGRMELWQRPDIICTITMLPLKRFHFDAAIMHSELMMIPHALGFMIKLQDNQPDPIVTLPLTVETIKNLQVEDSIHRLKYFGEAVTMTRYKLNGLVPLIGYTPGPFTVLSYILEGVPSRRAHRSRRWLYLHPKESHEVLTLLTDVIVDFIAMQVDSGAEMMLVHECNCNLLTTKLFETYCTPYLKRIYVEVNAKLVEMEIPKVPMMLFAQGATHDVSMKLQKNLGFEIITVNTTVTGTHARKIFGPGAILQGNLDPFIFYGYDDDIKSETKKMIAEFGTTNYIANIGEDAPVWLIGGAIDVFIQTVHDFRV